MPRPARTSWAAIPTEGDTAVGPCNLCGKRPKNGESVLIFTVKEPFAVASIIVRLHKQCMEAEIERAPLEQTDFERTKRNIIQTGNVFQEA